MMTGPRTLALLMILFAATAHAQDKGTVDPKPLPPLANPDDPKNPAKELFARRPAATKDLAARSIGFYSHGDRKSVV